MKKVFITLVLALCAAAFLIWYKTPVEEHAELYIPVPRQETQEVKKADANLNVPYINEAPDNVWTGSWKNACEEATIAMAAKYYEGKDRVTIKEAKEYMQMLFDIQQKTYGSDANSDAARTLEIIKNYSNFDGKVVENPTIEDIKKELDEGRPIIAFHYGFDLKNKNIPFLRTGSSYHTTVIKGYNDEKRLFIVNDPGDTKEGADHLYDYDLFMNSVHDYRYESDQADGPPRMIFTIPKN